MKKLNYLLILFLALNLNLKSQGLNLNFKAGLNPVKVDYSFGSGYGLSNEDKVSYSKIDLEFGVENLLRNTDKISWYFDLNFKVANNKQIQYLGNSSNAPDYTVKESVSILGFSYGVNYPLVGNTKDSDFSLGLNADFGLDIRSMKGLNTSISGSTYALDWHEPNYGLMGFDWMLAGGVYAQYLVSNNIYGMFNANYNLPLASIDSYQVQRISAFSLMFGIKLIMA